MIFPIKIAVKSWTDKELRHHKKTILIYIHNWHGKGIKYFKINKKKFIYKEKVIRYGCDRKF